MGCGSSSQVVPTEGTSNGHMMNGHENGHGVKEDHDRDDVSTVVLPDSPVVKKPPIAFEIPLEDIGVTRKESTPPPHLQRLLQPTVAEVTLPDIQERLAEAEMRRQMILQQRAASAQKRTQKIMKSFHEMNKVDSNEQNDVPTEQDDPMKHPAANTLTIPTEPGVCEGKNLG